MKQDFKNFIDSANSILIVLPKNPYFDQVASALSLYLALEKTKTVALTAGSPMTVEFNRLVGVDKITQEIGNKNLVIKFQNYQAQNIERVAYDIENNEFRLSVIPKPAMTPPEKEQIAISYSGISADTIILVGGGNETHFPLLTNKEFLTTRKAHIGLTSLNPASSEIYSFAKSSSSTSELTYDYIKELGLEVNSDIASNLLAGLHEGSKNFSTSYVTANTFKVASELMEHGGTYTHREPAKTYTPRDFGQPQPATPKVEAPRIEEPKQAVSQPVATSLPTQTSPVAALPDIDEEENEILDESAPKSWLEPKIFKGTNN